MDLIEYFELEVPGLHRQPLLVSLVVFSLVLLYLLQLAHNLRLVLVEHDGLQLHGFKLAAADVKPLVEHVLDGLHALVDHVRLAFVG